MDFTDGYTNDLDREQKSALDDVAQERAAILAATMDHSVSLGCRAGGSQLSVGKLTCRHWDRPVLLETYDMTTSAPGTITIQGRSTNIA